MSGKTQPRTLIFDTLCFVIKCHLYFKAGKDITLLNYKTKLRHMSSLEVNYALASSKGTWSGHSCSGGILDLINHCPTRYLDQLVHGRPKSRCNILLQRISKDKGVHRGINQQIYNELFIFKIYCACISGKLTKGITILLYVLPLQIPPKNSRFKYRTKWWSVKIVYYCYKSESRSMTLYTPISSRSEVLVRYSQLYFIKE